MSIDSILVLLSVSDDYYLCFMEFMGSFELMWDVGPFFLLPISRDFQLFHNFCKRTIKFSISYLDSKLLNFSTNFPSFFGTGMLWLSVWWTQSLVSCPVSWPSRFWGPWRTISTFPSTRWWRRGRDWRSSPTRRRYFGSRSPSSGQSSSSSCCSSWGLIARWVAVVCPKKFRWDSRLLETHSY